MVVYQGAVPQGYSIQRFRETGRTSKIVKGKEVLAKDSLKEKVKPTKKKILSRKALQSRKALKSRKILQKPTAKIKSIDAERIIQRQLGRQSLVREGRTGFFDSEMMEETKWLS